MVLIKFYHYSFQRKRSIVLLRIKLTETCKPPRADGWSSEYVSGPSSKSTNREQQGGQCSLLQNKSPSLPSALPFLFAGMSVNPGTCWGRGTRRCFRGHRPGSTSSFCLSCCAYVSSCCLDSAPLSSFSMGAGDGGGRPDSPEAAAPGAECGFDLVLPQPLGLLEGKVELSSR